MTNSGRMIALWVAIAASFYSASASAEKVCDDQSVIADDESCDYYQLGNTAVGGNFSSQAGAPVRVPSASTPAPAPVVVKRETLGLEFKSLSRKDCVARLSKAEDGVEKLEIPHSMGIEKYCNSLFRHHGERSSRLDVKLYARFKYEGESDCVHKLTSEQLEDARAEPVYAKQETAPQHCEALYDAQADAAPNNSSNESEVTTSAPSRSCVVHRRCGDYTVAEGQAVAGTCAAACTRKVCEGGKFVSDGICGKGKSCDGGPNGGSKPMSWCHGDPVAL